MQTNGENTMQPKMRAYILRETNSFSNAMKESLCLLIKRKLKESCMHWHLNSYYWS